jgi:hypothetical protein
LYANLFAEFFVVSSAEAADRRAIDAGELASGIIVIEYVVGRILLIAAFTISAFNYMYAIVFTIKQCINVTHFSPLPLIAGKYFSTC